MNPFKKIKSMVRGKPRPSNGLREAIRMADALQESNKRVLERNWPDGTWTLPVSGLSNVELDRYARFWLGQACELQLKVTIRKLVSEDRYYDADGNRRLTEDRYPENWVASASALNAVFNRADIDKEYQEYILGRLKSLGQLKA